MGKVFSLHMVIGNMFGRLVGEANLRYGIQQVLVGVGDSELVSAVFNG